MGPVWTSSKCTSSSLGIHITLHLPAEFRPNRTIRDRVMASYPFLKMAATASQFYFRLRFSWLPHLRRSKSTCTPYFREISQSTADILLLPVSENKRPPSWNSTSGSHHRHVILHLPTKFRPNRTNRDWVMTSYPFLKMAATASQFYFRLRLSWLRSSGKVEIYMHTKFRRDISIHGWDITTSGLWSKRPPCWNFNSCSDFYVCVTIGMSFCICLPCGHARFCSACVDTVHHGQRLPYLSRIHRW